MNIYLYSALDYASDLKEYWLRKQDITREMSCNLAKDVIASLQSAADADRTSQSQLRGKFFFGHVTTVLSLIANMQIHQVHYYLLVHRNYLLYFFEYISLVCKYKIFNYIT